LSNRLANCSVFFNPSRKTLKKRSPLKALPNKFWGFAMPLRVASPRGGFVQRKLHR
jgi:hypothetical protein